MIFSIGALGDVQWLRYRTSEDVGQEVGASVNRYYRSFESQRPAHVRCPEFKSDSPLFIKWDTPMDGQGFRWIALDRSTPYGQYDLLYIDSNGDGHLDDETPYQGRRSDQYRMAFNPFPVYLTGEDGPITYHLACQFYSYDERSRYLMMSSGGYYEGTVLIGGEPAACVLVDSNGNGTFDDTAEDFNADRILLGEGRDRREYFVGRYLDYEGTLYRLQIARDGAFVSLAAAPDVTFGVVQVPESLTKFSAGGVNGMYDMTPENGHVRLPEGTYRVYQWEIARQDKGQGWTLRGSNFPRQQSFTVSADTPARVAVGEPVFSRLSVSERQGIYSINQELQGKMNEQVSVLRNGRQPPAPKVHIRSQTGAYDRTFSLEYG
ncbi:MAG TPA: hypothetical protein ENN97_05260 [Phycisphaerales bacterium]|nr:hypothetical protein [Phycisphaerales bacterium]